MFLDKITEKMCFGDICVELKKTKGGFERNASSVSDFNRSPQCEGQGLTRFNNLLLFL